MEEADLLMKAVLRNSMIYFDLQQPHIDGRSPAILLETLNMGSLLFVSIISKNLATARDFLNSFQELLVAFLKLSLLFR